MLPQPAEKVPASLTPAHGPRGESPADGLLRPGPGESERAQQLLAIIDELLAPRKGQGPLDAPAERRGRLVGPDGHEIEIPASALAALRQVAAAMAQGQAVTVAPYDLELTTQQAADLLHVSRPHVIKLLEQGQMAYHRTSDDVGAHRRVLLRDVLDYRRIRRQGRREALRELSQVSQDAADGYR